MTPLQIRGTTNGLVKIGLEIYTDIGIIVKLLTNLLLLLKSQNSEMS